MGWRDGSVVKGMYCSCRKSEFGSQHPHGAAHKDLYSTVEDPMPPIGLHKQLHLHVYRAPQHICIEITKNKNKSLKMF